MALQAFVAQAQSQVVGLLIVRDEQVGAVYKMDLKGLVIRLDSTLLSLCRVQVQRQQNAVCVQPEVQKEQKSAI